MKNSPAFQFYPADYLADANVQMMTGEQEGHYIRLMAYCWREGFIPSDPKKLSLLCKGEEVSTAVQQRFNRCTNDGSKLVHPRLDIERKKQLQYSQLQAEKGVKSGKVRKQKALQNEPRFNNGSTGVRTETNSSSSSSSSSSDIKDKVKSVTPTNGVGDSTEFEMFWEAYPKKIGRKEAKRAWNKNLCDGHILEVLESLDAWKKTDQWREVQFIQYPATWLNKELFKEKPKNASTITGGENLYERAKRMEREAGISKRPH